MHLLLLCTHHSGVFGLLLGPVGAVLLVVEPAGVAKVVAGSVATPERGGGHSAVAAFATVCIGDNNVAKLILMQVFKPHILPCSPLLSFEGLFVHASTGDVDT